MPADDPEEFGLDPETPLAEPMDRGPHLLQYDPESFGRLSENVARYIGSWAFIAWMTVAIIAWVGYNILAPPEWRADPYPFIFLTLLLSLQASYAAPLILLAQNRESDRDRVQYSEDRQRTNRLLADTEYLMREIASLRSAVGEIATRDYVRSELRDHLTEMENLLNEQRTGATGGSKKRKGKHRADPAESEAP